MSTATLEREAPTENDVPLEAGPKLQPGADRGRSLAWKHSVALIAAAWCLYGSTISHPFLFDDLPNIRENATLRSWDGVGKILLENGRPVAMLTFAANYALSGNNVWSYHLVNLLVHAAAGLALYGLIRRTLLLSRGTGGQAGGAAGIALAISLLWLVHPLQTQAVTYVVQRMESLMGLLFLLSLYLTLRGWQSSRPALWYVLAIACCWLGMGCKQVMAACPLLLLMYDRIFLAGSWRGLLPRWWLHVGTFLSLAWLAWLTHLSMATQLEASAGFGVRGITAWEYLQSQGGVLLHYLRLTIWPDVLCFDYSWPKAESALAIYPQCGVILMLLLASLWLLWKQPKLGFVAMGFFLILAPTSSFMPIADLAFEHRMYLPLACVLTLLVFGVHYLLQGWNLAPQRRAVLGMALVAAAAILLGGRTMLRNRDYASDIGMWQLIARQRPESPRAYKNMAYLHKLAGRRNLAIENYEQALQREPDSYETYVEYGNLFYAERDYAAALRIYRRGIEAVPDQFVIWLNVALVQSRTGEMQEALESCAKARSLMQAPASRQERKIRAWVLSTAEDAPLRDGPEALRLLKTLKPLPKPDPDLLDRFAAAYAEVGDFAAALESEERAIAEAKAQKAPPQVMTDFAQHLALYQQKQPCRVKRAEHKME